MDITINGSDVTVSIRSSNVLSVEINDVDASDVINDVDASDVINEFTITQIVNSLNVDDLLNEIGIDAVKDYFNLIDDAG